MIMLVYSCIAPIISAIAMLYFGYAYLVYKYQLLYVYVDRSQAGGHMWFAVFDHSMLCLLVAQIVLLGYFAIRKTYQSGPLYFMIPLPLAVGYFWRSCRSHYFQPSKRLAMQEACWQDAASQQRTMAGQPSDVDSFVPTLFRQPSLAEGKLHPEMEILTQGACWDWRADLTGTRGGKGSSQLEEDLLV